MCSGAPLSWRSSSPGRAPAHARRPDQLRDVRVGHVVADLRLVQVKAGVPFMPALKSGAQKDRHGDSAVALMLAYAASRGPIMAYDYESVGSLAGRSGGDEDLRLPTKGTY